MKLKIQQLDLKELKIIHVKKEQDELNRRRQKRKSKNQAKTK